MKLELKEICWKCDGDKELYNTKAENHAIPCDQCKGTGYSLTQEGEEIKQFIEQHFHIEFKP